MQFAIMPQMKFVLLLLLLLCTNVLCDSVQRRRPLVLAHRGSSGEFPDLTMAGFNQAIRQGTDMLELDLVLTADKQVIVLHEPQLSYSTDVASRSQFASRRRNDTLWSEGGWQMSANDWFSWNLTLAEVQELRKFQRLSFRDSRWDGQEKVPTFRQLLQLAAEHQIGLLVELKLCDYLNNRTGADMVELVAADLEAEGMTTRSDLVQLQTFELSCASQLKRRLPRLKVFQLVSAASITDQQLRHWSEDLHLDGIGVNKAMIAGGGGSPEGQNFTNKYHVTSTTDLVSRAHKFSNFQVYVWTLRNEDRYIPWTFKQDVAEEILFHMRAGVDGIITDFPLTTMRVLDQAINVATAAAASSKTCIAASLVLTAALCLQRWL